MRFIYLLTFTCSFLVLSVLIGVKNQHNRYVERQVRMMNIQTEIDVLRGEYLRQRYIDTKENCSPLCESTMIETQGYGVTPHIKAYGGMGLNGHPGVDYVADEGSYIRATHDGVVFAAIDTESDSHVGYGNHVKLRQRSGESGFETVYAHMRDVLVKEGQVVKYGDIIGTVGNTGFSSAPHLHFGIRFLWFCNDSKSISAPCEVINGSNGMYGWVDPDAQDWYSLRHE